MIAQLSNLEYPDYSIEQIKIIPKIMFHKIVEARTINQNSMALNCPRSSLSILNGHLTGAGQPSINYGHPVSHLNSFALKKILRKPCFSEFKPSRALWY